jgi:nucleoside-diphosphate-sugar epimerase
MMKTVVIAGALGVIGRGVLAYYEDKDVELVAISRRTPDFPTRVRHLSGDLLDLDFCRYLSTQLTQATHLVFAAYQEVPSQEGLVKVNLRMLMNIVDALEAAAPNLRHITLMQGGKAYGVHLGGMPFSPAKETDPRHMPPNFYYDQEDFLRDRAEGKPWGWTALRPEGVVGLAIGNPMNLLMVIAVYGSIAKELGVPMSFPGSVQAYSALYQVTDTRILAQAVDWAGETAHCRSEVYNITNGDYFRWSRIWPRVAHFFDVSVGEPLPLSLSEVMVDKSDLWKKMVGDHGLRSHTYEEIVSWRFGDLIFKSTFDNITSTIKARQHGFVHCIDSEKMFIEMLTELRQQRFIP